MMRPRHMMQRANLTLDQEIKHRALLSATLEGDGASILLKQHKSARRYTLAPTERKEILSRLLDGHVPCRVWEFVQMWEREFRRGETHKKREQQAEDTRRMDAAQREMRKQEEARERDRQGRV